MQLFAIGIMNLDPGAFWHMTMGEYMFKCEGFRIREEKEWSRTKIVAFTTYRMLGGKDSYNQFLPDRSNAEANQEAIKAIAANKESIKERYKNILKR